MENKRKPKTHIKHHSDKLDWGMFMSNMNLLVSAKGWNYQEAARELGYTGAESRIWDFISGRSRPSPAELVHISNILEVTIDDLLKKKFKVSIV